MSLFKNFKLIIPISWSEKNIIIKPAIILKTLELVKKNLPINEAVVPKAIKTKEAGFAEIKRYCRECGVELIILDEMQTVIQNRSPGVMASITDWFKDLMNHWESVLPKKMLRVSYEELIADQEYISKQMINFCKLDWEEECLNFHSTKFNNVFVIFDKLHKGRSAKK